MQRGKCKLCLQVKEICASHFLPKAIYRMLRDLRAKNPNPILVANRIMIPTSRQMVAYILCSECEQLLSAKGERYTLRQMCNKGKFPLLETLQATVPELTGVDFVGYSSDKNPKIDIKSLAYFALRVLWKAAAHEWQQIQGIRTEIELGPYREALRTYIRGETAFPENVAVRITVCTDRVSQLVVYEPTIGEPIEPMPFKYYELHTLGINFGMCLGPQLAKNVRDFCAFRSAKKWIFVRNWEAKTLNAMRRTSKNE